MLLLDRVLVSSYRLSVVPCCHNLPTPVFGGVIRSYRCIGSCAVTCITFPSLRVQATKYSKHHNWIVMDTGCDCVPGSAVGYPSDSWTSYMNVE